MAISTVTRTVIIGKHGPRGIGRVFVGEAMKAMKAMKVPAWSGCFGALGAFRFQGCRDWGFAWLSGCANCTKQGISTSEKITEEVRKL